jgi:PHD/YefM family antitoxin component YafN of YafNO toxin-antitoxin module
MMEVRVQFHAPTCVLSQNEPSIFIAKEVRWALANANDIKLCESINTHFYF